MFLDASRELAAREESEREAQRQRELSAAQNLAEEQERRAEEQTRAAEQLRRRAYFLASAFVLAGVAFFFSNQASRNASTALQNAQAASHAQATAVANADAAQKAQADAVTQRDTAQKSEAQAVAQRQIAAARELEASAIANLNIDPERSILLAMQAVTTTYAVDQSTTKEAVEALHSAIQNSRLRLTLHPNTGDNGSVAFSPDGKRLVTGGRMDRSSCGIPPPVRNYPGFPLTTK